MVEHQPTSDTVESMDLEVITSMSMESTPSGESSGDKKKKVSHKSILVTDTLKLVDDPAGHFWILNSRPFTGHQTPASATSSGMDTPAVSSATSVSLVGVGRITPNFAQNTFGSSTSKGFPGKQVSAGSQIGQREIGRSKNVLAVGPTSPGAHDFQFPSTATVAEQPGADLHKAWEGLLGMRGSNHVFICRLQAFCRETSSKKASSKNIALDWPPTMDIERLIPRDEVKRKKYGGQPIFLSFNALDHHSVFETLAERKLCGEIKLPTQILLLSNFDSPSNLMGMVFTATQLPSPAHLQQQQQLTSQQQRKVMPLATGQALSPSQFSNQKQHQLRGMPLTTGQGFLPSQFSNEGEHQLGRPQPRGIPLATGQGFLPSQFSNEGEHLLGRPQPRGMSLATGQAFPPSQFSNQGQHQHKNPLSQQALPFATGQPFLPSQFSNKTIPPISLGQQQQQPVFLSSQFPNQSVPLSISMLLGQQQRQQQQPEGMPSSMGQAFPRQDPGYGYFDYHDI